MNQRVRTFAILAAALGIIVLCGVLLAALERGRNNATPTQELLIIPTPLPTLQQPTISSEIPTTQPQPIITSPSFTAGTYWYPYRCTAETPTRCTFALQDTTTEYWAQCQEPNKYRPTYYTADPYVDWYILGEDGILYPAKEGSNLQSFKFLEEGQAK